MDEKAALLFSNAVSSEPDLCALARFNLEQSVIQRRILRLEEAVEGLNPLLIYLDAEGTRETLEKVSKERPRNGWIYLHYHASRIF